MERECRRSSVPKEEGKRREERNTEGSVDFEGCYEIGRIITPPAKQWMESCEREEVLIVEQRHSTDASSCCFSAT